MDGWALAVAILALVVAIVGTSLSNKRAKESRDIAREALDDVQAARTEALWSSAVEAVMRVIGLDPTAEPVQEPLRNLRVHLVALVDGLPEWDGLGAWVAAESARGAVIARELLEHARPGATTDERFARLEPYLTWGINLSQNLRDLRRKGHYPDAIAQLRVIAQRDVEAIHVRNGWDLPENPLTPL